MGAEKFAAAAVLLLLSCGLKYSNGQVLSGLGAEVHTSVEEYASQHSARGRLDEFDRLQPWRKIHVGGSLPTLAAYIQYCLEKHPTLSSGGRREFMIAAWRVVEGSTEPIAAAYNEACSVPEPSDECARSPNLLLMGMISLPGFGSNSGEGSVGVAVMWTPSWSPASRAQEKELLELMASLETAAKAAIRECQKHVLPSLTQQSGFLTCVDNVLKDKYMKVYEAVAVALVLPAEEKLGALGADDGGVSIYVFDSTVTASPPAGAQVAYWALVLILDKGGSIAP